MTDQLSLLNTRSEAPAAQRSPTPSQMSTAVDAAERRYERGNGNAVVPDDSDRPLCTHLYVVQKMWVVRAGKDAAVETPYVRDHGQDGTTDTSTLTPYALDPFKSPGNLPASLARPRNGSARMEAKFAYSVPEDRVKTKDLLDFAGMFSGDGLKSGGPDGKRTSLAGKGMDLFEVSNLEFRAGEYGGVVLAGERRVVVSRVGVDYGEDGLDGEVDGAATPVTA